MSGNVKFNGWINDDGSENYKCRAWVNFNGEGTVAIRASGGVSSITDNGTGDYSVNFTTAMVDANYCITCSATRPAATQCEIIGPIQTQTSSSCRVQTKNDGGVIEDCPLNSVAIFR